MIPKNVPVRSLKRDSNGPLVACGNGKAKRANKMYCSSPAVLEENVVAVVRPMSYSITLGASQPSAADSGQGLNVVEEWQKQQQQQKATH